MNVKNPVITVAVPAGKLNVYQLHPQSEAEIPIAWALVIVNDLEPETAYLWYIQTRSKFRRDGCAKKLINSIQRDFKRIVTNYEKGPISGAGTKLCVACGFELKPSMFKRIPNELIWEKRDADRNGEKAESQGQQNGEGGKIEGEAGGVDAG